MRTLRRWPGAGPAWAGRSSSLPTPFVGRQSELDLLVDCWRESVERERQVVLVAGEPGIGKSRLAWELVRVADAVALKGRCDPDRLVPYQPFLEALAQLRAVCSAEALARHLFATWPPLSSRGLCPTYREVCRPSSQAIPGQSAIGSSQL